jgi:magnesium transporter
MTEHLEFLERLQADVQALLERADTAALREYTADLHPSDIADLLEHLEDDQRLELLHGLSPELAAETLAEMEGVGRPGRLLVELDSSKAAAILDELADDDAADLIGSLPETDQSRLLSLWPDSTEIQDLLVHPEESAGGIMTGELVSLPVGLSAGEALAEIRDQASDVEDFYTLFVVYPDRRLRGVVSLQRLVLADPATPLSDLVEEPPAAARVDMDQEEVARLLIHYNLASIGVLDHQGRLVGRITFDDVIDVLEAETTEDLLRFAAVSEEEEVQGSVAGAVKSRLPWLIANLGTATLGGLVVLLFQDAIERVVALAVVMPIVAALGGNAGTQALAVTIRRIALEGVSLADRRSVIGKELVVGLSNGMVVGFVSAGIGMLLGVGPLFGLVVLLAMWGNLIVASFSGALFPILLDSIGIDPAIASSVLVTAFTDVIGFFLLLGLGSAVLL